MGIHEYSWVFIESQDILGYPKTSIDINGYSSIFMDIHGDPWKSMEIHGYPWISIGISKVSLGSAWFHIGVIL